MRFPVICTLGLCFAFLVLPFPAFGKQGAYGSPVCPTTPEGARYFNLANDFYWGRGGKPGDLFRAEIFFEKALRAGDSRAGVNLGMIYRMNYVTWPDERERDRLSIRFYEESIAMGCPDGYLNLADAYSKGWGVRVDDEKAMELLRTGAEKDSINCLLAYGRLVFKSLITRQGYERMRAYGYRIPESSIASEEAVKETRAKGIALMEKALLLGNGHAGYELGMTYARFKDPENAIRAVREGSRLGSKESLYLLRQVYLHGDWGQAKDTAYAEKINALRDSIDDKATPAPISEFDKKIPPKPVLPMAEGRR